MTEGHPCLWAFISPVAHFIGGTTQCECVRWDEHQVCRHALLLCPVELPWGELGREVRNNRAAGRVARQAQHTPVREIRGGKDRVIGRRSGQRKAERSCRLWRRWGQFGCEWV